MIDPDAKSDEETEKVDCMFDTVMDKIEYELNQNDINLTDGFYSSDEESEN